MASKTTKSLIIEQSCLNCDAPITFPNDVKTVLCPKCRTSFRVHHENGKLHLREPDRRDDLAAALTQVEGIEFEIAVLLDKTVRMERFGLLALIPVVILLAILLWGLGAALAPRGDWDTFTVAAVLLCLCLCVVYWLTFNPLDNRKIMKLLEERTALRRRMETM